MDLQSGKKVPRGRISPHVFLLGGLLTSLLWAPGCAHLGVESWERDMLAAPQMQLTSDPMDAGLDDHIYFSREASSGGRGFGGGGCGCN